MSTRENRRDRNRSRSRPQRRWNRDPITGRLRRNNDEESNTRSNRNQSRSRSRSRSRDRGATDARRTIQNRLNPNFMDRFLEDILGDNNNNNNHNHNNNERKENENGDDELPSIPDNFDQELEEALGVTGARLFEESARLCTSQMDRRQSEIPQLVSSLIRDYIRLRGINLIQNDEERRGQLRLFQRDLVERQMEESHSNAVVGTDLTHLRQSLNNLRSMMYDTSNQVGQNQFTLQLTIDINNVPTRFDGIVVTRIDIPDEQHRKITNKEEDDNKDNDSFECGICIERFKNGENVTTLKDCGHQFHKQCVSQWIKDKGLCPFCRGKVNQFKCESDIGTVYI